MKIKIVSQILAILILISFGTYYSVNYSFPEDIQLSEIDFEIFKKESSLEHVKYFGFAGIDCENNYIKEVSGFTNIAHLCIESHKSNIINRIDEMNSVGIQPLIAIENIFVNINQNEEGIEYILYEDYEERWDEFKNLNKLEDYEEKIAAFYLPDEPFLNNLSYEDLKSISDMIKIDFPSIPIVLIEAHTNLEELIIPSSVDWVGFDQYDTIDPTMDASYISNYKKLKTKINSNQKIVLVMDTQWRPYYGEYGVKKEDMANIGFNYAKFASSEEEIIAVIGYIWFSGLDERGQVGGRDLPNNVKEFYQDLGEIIT